MELDLLMPSNPENEPAGLGGLHNHPVGWVELVFLVVGGKRLEQLVCRNYRVEVEAVRIRIQTIALTCLASGFERGRY